MAGESKKKVLLVDDDADFVAANRIALEAKGYQVVTAPDSRAGVETALREVPDLVVVDLMMEELDAGFALVESLQNHPKTAGVPILMSLEMTSEVANNYVVEKAYIDMREAARRGQALGETVARTKVFPIMVAHMITIGEQTGRLEEMLGKVADWFEQELDEKIKRLTAVIEPLLIIFVGGIVALVASAIFLPIVGAIQAML